MLTKMSRCYFFSRSLYSLDLYSLSFRIVLLILLTFALSSSLFALAARRARRLRRARIA